MPEGLTHTVRRMVGRDPAEHGRASTPLELLFDLTFVIAFGAASDQLAEALAHGDVREVVLAFCLATFAVTWAWINFTWFASAYDTDDWPFRLTTGTALTFGVCGRPTSWCRGATCSRPTAAAPSAGATATSRSSAASSRSAPACTWLPTTSSTSPTSTRRPPSQPWRCRWRRTPPASTCSTRRSPARSSPFHALLIVATAALLVLPVLLAAAGVDTVWCLAVLAPSPWVTVVGYETVGHRHHAEVLAAIAD